MNIGVGRAFVVNSVSELSRLKKSIALLKAEYEKNSYEKSIDDKDVFVWYSAVLDDIILSSKLLKYINEGKNAETAVSKAFDELICDFSKNESELIRSRAEDLADIRDDLIRLLLKEKKLDFSSAPKGSVLVLKSLTPSSVFKISKSNISAVVTCTGSSISHAAILARARGIPVVFAANNFSEIENGDVLIVNSDDKTVIIDKYKRV